MSDAPCFWVTRENVQDKSKDMPERKSVRQRMNEYSWSIISFYLICQFESSISLLYTRCVLTSILYLYAYQIDLLKATIKHDCKLKLCVVLIIGYLIVSMCKCVMLYWRHWQKFELILLLLSVESNWFFIEFSRSMSFFWLAFIIHEFRSNCTNLKKKIAMWWWMAALKWIEYFSS